MIGLKERVIAGGAALLNGVIAYDALSRQFHANEEANRTIQNIVTCVFFTGASACALVSMARKAITPLFTFESLQYKSMVITGLSTICAIALGASAHFARQENACVIDTVESKFAETLLFGTGCAAGYLLGTIAIEEANVLYERVSLREE